VALRGRRCSSPGPGRSGEFRAGCTPKRAEWPQDRAPLPYSACTSAVSVKPLGSRESYTCHFLGSTLFPLHRDASRPPKTFGQGQDLRGKKLKPSRRDDFVRAGAGRLAAAAVPNTSRWGEAARGPGLNSLLVGDEASSKSVSPRFEAVVRAEVGLTDESIKFRPWDRPGLLGGAGAAAGRPLNASGRPARKDS